LKPTAAEVRQSAKQLRIALSSESSQVTSCLEDMELSAVKMSYRIEAMRQLVRAVYSSLSCVPVNTVT
jgi:hypothetical protein